MNSRKLSEWRLGRNRRYDQKGEWKDMQIRVKGDEGSPGYLLMTEIKRERT